MGPTPGSKWVQPLNMPQRLSPSANPCPQPLASNSKSPTPKRSSPPPPSAPRRRLRRPPLLAAAAADVLFSPRRSDHKKQAAASRSQETNRRIQIAGIKKQRVSYRSKKSGSAINFHARI